MKGRILFHLMVFGLLTFSINLFAQERMVKGMVTTFDSIPLIDATVMVKSTKQVVFTDSLGLFTVNCDKNDKLKVSAHGFYNQNVQLEEKTKFAAVNLKMKAGEKNREYAIGYGHVTDVDKLNSLSSLKNDDFDFSRYNNIFDLIRGKCAGVQVVENKYIVIRGVNSINAGESSALVLVNGVPYSMDALKSIQPSQVKSIDVVKDAGAAIYGARGANGVVLIETKKGGNN